MNLDDAWPIVRMSNIVATNCKDGLGEQVELDRIHMRGILLIAVPCPGFRFRIPIFGLSCTTLQLAQ